MAKNIFTTILGLTDSAEILELGVSDIASNPHQPRETFHDDALQGLAESIRDVGVIQPVVVRRRSGAGKKYELVVGERRLRAAQIAGLRKIPAIVKDISSDASMRLALVENIQREDLTPIEEAHAYSYLKLNLGLSQMEIARFVGKSQPLVSVTMRLLSLPPEVQRFVADGRVSRSQARAILRIHDREQQIAVARRLQKEHLHVAEIDRLAAPVAMPRRAAALQNGVRSVHSALNELRRNGADVDTSEHEDDACRILKITLKIPKK
jgi:ParB family transcriptional regulator, chromosome partitioning protein